MIIFDKLKKYIFTERRELETAETSHHVNEGRTN